MSMQSWSPEDHVRHFQLEAIHRVLVALPWENRPYATLDFPGKWYADPDGGWQSHLRTMMKSILGPRLVYTGATYPEVDIQKMPYAYEAFDLCLIDQVLEHVAKIWIACDEIYRVCKKGGIAVVSTPGLYPEHRSRLDCWRIFKDGYHVLFDESRWSWISFGQWGNAQRVGYEYLYNGAFPYSASVCSVEQAMQQPYYVAESEERYPIQLWLIARRRS